MQQQNQLPQQVQKECLTLNNGLDNEIASCFNGDKLNLVSPVILKQNLAYIFTLIGLTRLPDPDEYSIIEDFIRTSYPMFTIQEFRIAFKLATLGKLDCNVEHYEKFSGKFISQVMNAYKSKANDVRKQIKPINQLPVPKLTEDEIVDFTRNDWNNSYKTDFNKIFNISRVFDILLKQNKLNIDPNEYTKIMNIVNEDNIARINKMLPVEAKEFKEQIKNANYFDRQCKALVLAKYFENETNKI